MMRFLVVGLGSMGKRRIRNLQHLGAGEIAGFDPRADRRAEAASASSVPTFGDFDAALSQHKPDALIVSTPPDLHVHYARKAVAAGRHVFCEASVVDDGMTALASDAAREPRLTVAPSCTFRFHPSVQLVREIVSRPAFGKPLLFTYHSGQWLPDWHPWEDYRTFYVAKRTTGACREIVPFELSWITWIFGAPVRVACMKSKQSTLDADIDDSYQSLLELAGGARGHMLVDVIARQPVRLFRALSESATVEWDAVARVVREYDAVRKSWVEHPEPRGETAGGYVYAETMYIEEMRAFAAACRGEERWPYTVADDMKNLAVLTALEESSDSGRFVELSP